LLTKPDVDPMPGLIHRERNVGEVGADRSLEALDKGPAVSLFQGNLPVLDQEKAIGVAESLAHRGIPAPRPRRPLFSPRPCEMERRGGISSFSMARKASISDSV